MKKQPLYEKYRPHTWVEVLGQDKVVHSLQELEAGYGFGGQAFLFSGPAGSGKTTIANILARSVADEAYIVELDATRLTPARLADIEDECRYAAFGLGGRAYIVNECHGLSKAAVTQLLTTLERIPEHVTWIFTTTRDGLANFEDLVQGEAFLSRCLCYPLAQRGLAEIFAERAQEIAEKEHLNGKPLAAYVKLVQKHKNNLRATLQDIQRGMMKE